MQMPANSNCSAGFPCALISEISAEVGSRVAGGVGKTVECHRICLMCHTFGAVVQMV